MLNLAIFLDTFNETNGVSITYKNYFLWNEKFKKTKTIILSVADNDQNTIGKYTKIFLLKPHLMFRLPLYKDILIGFPQIKTVKNLLIKNHINAILLTSPGPMGILGKYLSKKLNIPVFCFYHTRFEKFVKIYGEHYGGKSLGVTFTKFSDYLHKSIYKNCKAIFIQSEELKKDLLKFNNKHIHLIPIGIDREIFKPLRKTRTKRDALAYVGRIAMEKNIEIIVKILPFLKSAGIDLKLIGDGPYRKTIEKMMNIKATGFVEQKLIPGLLKSCSALLFPSVTDTVGNVVFEAVSMGIPVIIAKDTPIAKIVNKYHCGLEFDPKKPSDLKEKIIFLLKNKDKFISEEIKKNKDLFSYNSTFSEMIKIIKTSTHSTG